MAFVQQLVSIWSLLIALAPGDSSVCGSDEKPAASAPKATAQAEKPAEPKSPEVAPTEKPAQPAAEDAEALPPITSPREIFEARGLDAQRLAKFIDGRSVVDEEQETLWRMLMVIGRFDFVDIRRWAARNVDWITWAREPAIHRGEILELQGKVKRVTLEKLTPRDAERYQFDHYYRCEMQLGDERDPAVVYALKIPKAWKLDEPLDERAGVRGFFVKLSGEKPEPLGPVFAARRVAWYPHTELGDLGMDYGLFDDVNTNERLSLRDQECFFELLAAAKRANGRELRERTREQKFSVIPLFVKAEDQKGKLVALTGTARRVIQIRIENPATAAAYGIDSYYEVEVFTEDSQGNPITFDVVELPPGMPTGEDIQEDIRIAGFFMKTWTYRIHSIDPKDDQNGAKRQIAPLLLTRDFYRIVRQPPDQQSELTKGAIFGLIILGLGGGAWWLSRSDRRHRDRALSKKYALENERALNDIGKQN